jgi:hypothetical protein
MVIRSLSSTLATATKQMWMAVKLKPYDERGMDGDQEIFGIPDWTTGALLRRLSRTKCDNIVRVTVWHCFLFSDYYFIYR